MIASNIIFRSTINKWWNQDIDSVPPIEGLEVNYNRFKLVPEATGYGLKIKVALSLNIKFEQKDIVDAGIEIVFDNACW